MVERLAGAAASLLEEVASAAGHGGEPGAGGGAEDVSAADSGAEALLSRPARLLLRRSRPRAVRLVRCLQGEEVSAGHPPTPPSPAAISRALPPRPSPPGVATGPDRAGLLFRWPQAWVTATPARKGTVHRPPPLSLRLHLLVLVLRREASRRVDPAQPPTTSPRPGAPPRASHRPRAELVVRWCAHAISGGGIEDEAGFEAHSCVAAALTGKPRGRIGKGPWHREGN